MIGRVELLVSGFGGQGVVRLGQIVSTAAVHQGLYTSMLISHGTETRGGYVRTQNVIADEPINSPVVESPDFFCAMSKAAYDRFKGLVSQGVILYDPGFVDPDPNPGVRHIAFPAREIAVKELGREIFFNVVFLGGLGKLMAGTLEREFILKAMLERIPRFHAENTRALELGYSLMQA